MLCELGYRTATLSNFNPSICSSVPVFQNLMIHPCIMTIRNSCDIEINMQLAFLSNNSMPAIGPVDRRCHAHRRTMECIHERHTCNRDQIHVHTCILDLLHVEMLVHTVVRI